MTVAPVLMLAVSGVAHSLLAMPFAAEATSATPTADTPVGAGNRHTCRRHGRCATNTQGNIRHTHATSAAFGCCVTSTYWTYVCQRSPGQCSIRTQTGKQATNLKTQNTNSKQRTHTHTPDATPASTPEGLASSWAAKTPTAVMMMAPGYWNRAPDSRPPVVVRQVWQVLAGKGPKAGESEYCNS